MTAKQRRAIYGLYLRSPDGSPNVARFFERFKFTDVWGAILGNWSGMIVGIETDGTVHT